MEFTNLYFLQVVLIILLYKISYSSFLILSVLLLFTYSITHKTFPSDFVVNENMPIVFYLGDHCCLNLTGFPFANFIGIIKPRSEC